ncbi:hypothetical protein F383_38186 [Gossypium arboreum]|uniref:Uncharacterized protein n=1 Tax=Gossypium arboreum TaxID=29729 RepID=A0A0B0MJT0_GOSAR|nr:hypothetical protein F383_38186 [Gossypium arboreum]
MSLSQTGCYTIYDANVPNMTWSYMESHIRILCHDICILTIPKVRTVLSNVVTRSIQAHKYCSHA